MNAALWLMIDLAALGGDVGAPEQTDETPVAVVAEIVMPAPPVPVPPAIWVCETEYGVVSFDRHYTPGVDGCFLVSLSCEAREGNPVRVEFGDAWDCAEGS